MDLTIPTRLAIKFAFNTGIEFELLYAEALEAYWRALTDPRYDPRRAALSTWAYMIVSCRLRDFERKYRREAAVPYVPLDAALDVPSSDPSAERVCYFWELLRQLPEDGRTIVDLALNDNVPVTGAKTALHHLLRNWTTRRINEACAAVTGALRLVETINA